MLDLTPSLQYNVIAALSPRTGLARIPRNLARSHAFSRLYLGVTPLICARLGRYTVLMIEFEGVELGFGGVTFSL
eukprot:5241808-Prymnesium_polylepis.1